MIIIRKANNNDRALIKEIYDRARLFMQNNGNPNQWPSYYPDYIEIDEDIAKEELFVGEENNKLLFCFTLIIGKDPTYNYIENGKWLNDSLYGTIHRLASNGDIHNVFNMVMDYCIKIIDNIRIDTHEDNLPMKHLIKKYGFKECGIIYTHNNTPRIAYQYCII